VLSSFWLSRRDGFLFFTMPLVPLQRYTVVVVAAVAASVLTNDNRLVGVGSTTSLTFMSLFYLIFFFLFFSASGFLFGKILERHSWMFFPRFLKLLTNDN